MPAGPVLRSWRRYLRKFKTHPYPSANSLGVGHASAVSALSDVERCWAAWPQSLAMRAAAQLWSCLRDMSRSRRRSHGLRALSERNRLCRIRRLEHLFRKCKKHAQPQIQQQDVATDGLLPLSSDYSAARRNRICCNEMRLMPRPRSGYSDYSKNMRNPRAGRLLRREIGTFSDYSKYMRNGIQDKEFRNDAPLFALRARIFPSLWRFSITKPEPVPGVLTIPCFFRLQSRPGSIARLFGQHFWDASRTRAFHRKRPAGRHDSFLTLFTSLAFPRSGLDPGGHVVEGVPELFVDAVARVLVQEPLKLLGPFRADGRAGRQVCRQLGQRHLAADRRRRVPDKRPRDVNVSSASIRVNRFCEDR